MHYLHIHRVLVISTRKNRKRQPFHTYFSDAYLMTRAEDSVSEPPHLKIFRGRIPPDSPSRLLPSGGTRDNAPPSTPPGLQKTWLRPCTVEPTSTARSNTQAFCISMEHSSISSIASCSILQSIRNSTTEKYFSVAFI